MICRRPPSNARVDARRPPAHRRTVESAAVFLALLLAISDATAQVNTEALRHQGDEEGWSNSIGFDFTLDRGNTEFLQLGASVRSDLLLGAWYSFLSGRYERGTTGEDVFLNRGFAHVRVVRSLTPRLGLEAFVQKEFNDFVRLRDRNLIGGGVRLGLLDIQADSTGSAAVHLHVGVGAMWEYERTSGAAAAISRVVRSTNYVAFAWRPDARVETTLTGYWQPDIEDPGDMRVLLESQERFSITDLLAFTVAFNMRYDSRPPPDLRTYDLELTNGIAVHF